MQRGSSVLNRRQEDGLAELNPFGRKHRLRPGAITGPGWTSRHFCTKSSLACNLRGMLNRSANPEGYSQVVLLKNGDISLEISEHGCFPPVFILSAEADKVGTGCSRTRKRPYRSGRLERADCHLNQSGFPGCLWERCQGRYQGRRH